MSNEHPQPRSRNTAMGGKSQAQMILQQSIHDTVMVGSVDGGLGEGLMDGWLAGWEYKCIDRCYS